MTFEDDSDTSGQELRVLTQILESLTKIDSQSRQRILDTVVTYFETSRNPNVMRPATEASTRPNQNNTEPTTSFSQDRSISPKQFVFEKQPKTDVEKVACLAYYLTHYRNIPHFKTLDISKLNTEAAQIKFSNAAVAVDNATRSNYLVPATKGNKQLSSLGEQFVLALPDRDRARTMMASGRVRRKSRRLPPTDTPERSTS